MWLFYSLITLSISIFSMNCAESAPTSHKTQSLPLTQLCRNVRLELTDFFNSHSKFSLIFFAVFLSGCKHTNYFKSDNKKINFFLFVFIPKKT